MTARSTSPEPTRQYVLTLPSGEQIDVNVECDEVSWRPFEHGRWLPAQMVPEHVTVRRTA